MLSDRQVRRIHVGGVDPSVLSSRLAQAGVRLNLHAEHLLAGPRFATSQARSFVDVACITVADLGFDAGATFDELLARAGNSGLRRCELEVAVQFRLQYLDQPEGAVGQPETHHRAPPGSITVVSAPPLEEDEPWGFYLRRIAGELWLRGYRSWSGHRWSPEDVLAFAVATSAA